ncbi:ras modification protein, ERF4 superfamily [Histoplasma capsulatum]|uniref:Ras modification protein ERF4 n=1 Tax=Ajellomyces capsulatus TaxID=5037 RepID=A0A8A1MJ13_AJECA|nr:ras modification protein, ERF4 superfamily [Histoplasma capsulatum]
MLLLVTKPAPKPFPRLLFSPITARGLLQFFPRQHQPLLASQTPWAILSSCPQQPRRPTPYNAQPIYHRGRLKKGPPTYQPPLQRTANTPHQRRNSQGRSLFSSIRTSIRKPPSSRLWNPINYVPRTTVVTAPRPSPISDTSPYIESQRDAYPLLTIPEQRRSRQQPSPTSLLVERSAADTESGRASVGLPPGQRRSGVWDKNNMGNDPGQSPGAIRGDADNIHRPDPALLRTNGLNPNHVAGAYPDRPREVPSQHSLRSQAFASIPSTNGNHSSGGGGGADGDVAEELAWGPSHPCFPHMNPHVPVTSDEYQNTRIIRIRRDWMVKGDLAPTFSNLYPEILDPILPELEFRTVIAKINKELISAFDPYSVRNWLDGAIGLVTGWVWDDLGVTGIKSHLKSIEQWLEHWNETVGSTEGVKIWSLRSTGYMSVDIQIPDPKVGIVETDAASATDMRPNTAGRNAENHFLPPSEG